MNTNDFCDKRTFWIQILLILNILLVINQYLTETEFPIFLNMDLDCKMDDQPEVITEDPGTDEPAVSGSRPTSTTSTSSKGGKTNSRPATGLSHRSPGAFLECSEDLTILHKYVIFCRCSRTKKFFQQTRGRLPVYHRVVKIAQGLAQEWIPGKRRKNTFCVFWYLNFRSGFLG